MKRIYSFQRFISESYQVNEGLAAWFSNFFTKAKEKLSGWFQKFFDALDSGEIKKIPSGPKAGKPMVMVFPQALGPITTQLQDVYGSKKMSESQIDEARYGQRWEDVPGLKGSVDNVSPDELGDEVKKYYRSKLRGSDPNPIFVYGAPGIGKTGVIAQVCDDLNLDMINIDIQFMSPEDFMGVPTVQSEEDPQYQEVADPQNPDKTMRTRMSPGSGFTRFNAPVFLPTDNGSEGNGGIIFLDEFNRPQTKSIMDALMNFVQSGRIGQYKLPPKWIIVAAGNRPGEAEVAEPDPALGRRFQIVNLVTSVKDFEKYAKEKNPKILPELIYFLSSGPGGKPNEDLLHYLDPDVDPLTFPAPANWTKACEMLHDEVEDAGVSSWKDLPMEVVEKPFRRKVGPNAAGKFMTYLKLMKEIEDKDLDLMSQDPQGTKMLTGVQKEKQILYAVMDMALRRIGSYDPKRLANLIEYFDRYQQNEMLAWLYGKIQKMHPEFSNLDDDTADGDKERALTIATNAAKKKVS